MALSTDSTVSLPKYRKPISSRFPLDQCNLVMLKDTRHSIRVSLKSVTDWYKFEPALSYARSLITELDKDQDDLETVPAEEDTKESEEAGDGSSSPISSLFSGSSSSKSVTSVEDEEESSPASSATGKSLLKPANTKRELEYKDTRFRLKQLISETLQVQEVEEDLANYTINSVLCDNEFIKLTLKPSQPIRKDVKASLSRLIKLFYTDSYLTKYREKFFDEVCGGFSLHNSHQDLNDPKWFELFLKIWKFDPESCELYDESYFADYMLSVYQSLEPKDVFHDQLVKTGLFMNLLRFRIYYSKLNTNFINYGTYGLNEEEEEEEESIDEINKRYLQAYMAGKGIVTDKAEDENNCTIKFCDRIQIRMFDDDEPPSLGLDI